MQQHNLVFVEGTVERQQGLVASEEADVRLRRQLARRAAAGGGSLALRVIVRAGAARFGNNGRGIAS